jgi:nucleoside-diphosphate-sugar epimerase
MSQKHIDLSNRRILVTGGTGFIGGRLVETLITDCKAKVRVLVRNFSSAGQLARFPVEMVHGDVLHAAEVERAAKDCDLVFHCAYGNSGEVEAQRRVNVDGTKNVLTAALNNHVKRVVHLSSLMVYGITPDGDLDETCAQHYFGDVYADSKLEAEKLVLDYGKRHGVPAVVLQPTAVYGPYSPAWTIRVLRMLQTGRMILVNGGNGLCNGVYVDDVVAATILAGVKENAVGEAFLISSEEPITWKRFYEKHEQMLGFTATVSMSAEEARSYYKQKQTRKGIVEETIAILREDAKVRQRVLSTREMRTLRSLAGRIVPDRFLHLKKPQVGVSDSKNWQQPEGKDEKPITPLSPIMIDLHTPKTRVRIDKAKRILGYQPAFDFDSGLDLTEKWARWANLLR